MNDVSSGKAEAKVPPVPRHGIESWSKEAKGYRVVFAKASVFQERNVHDLVRDMRQEYLERVPITWNHVIEKDSLKITELEHVLIERVEQLFRDIL